MQTTRQPESTETAGAEDSIRPVIEHALVDYGYSAETARKIVDTLVHERTAQ